MDWKRGKGFRDKNQIFFWDKTDAMILKSILKIAKPEFRTGDLQKETRISRRILLKHIDGYVKSGFIEYVHKGLYKITKNQYLRNGTPREILQDVVNQSHGLQMNGLSPDTELITSIVQMPSLVSEEELTKMYWTLTDDVIKNIHFKKKSELRNFPKRLLVAFLINTNPDEIRNSKLIAHGMRNGKKLVSELNKKYPDRKMYEKKLIKELKKKGIKIGETYYSD